jgi:alpha-beta hydrolase superfamily lysophospholipase
LSIWICFEIRISCFEFKSAIFNGIDYHIAYPLTFKGIKCIKGRLMADYSQIDQSPLISFLFYPRRDTTPCPEGAFDLLVPVEKGISVACRFFAGHPSWPWILFFHGNGEVASDYDEIAPFYHHREINLAVADYRGYGASGGSPGFTYLINDGHLVFKAVREELSRKGLGEDLWVMGRSMGSLSAVELAHRYPEEMKGLIVESGFASVTRLIKHLNLPARGLNLEPIEEERLAMIRQITMPALIIHGELDMLVPLQEAKDLYRSLNSSKKKLVIIPHADHNTIMFADLKQYFSEIQEFVQSTKLSRIS